MNGRIERDSDVAIDTCQVENCRHHILLTIQ